MSASGANDVLGTKESAMRRQSTFRAVRGSAFLPIVLVLLGLWGASANETAAAQTPDSAKMRPPIMPASDEMGERTTSTGILKGRTVIYKARGAEIYLTARHLGTSVSAVSATPDGKEKRTFLGDLEARDREATILIGEARFDSASGGGKVIYAFNARGETAETWWKPAAGGFQYIKWTCVPGTGNANDSAPGAAQPNDPK